MNQSTKLKPKLIYLQKSHHIKTLHMEFVYILDTQNNIVNDCACLFLAKC